MFDWTRSGKACRKYRLQLEDRVSGEASPPRAELEKHLRQCAHCREALESAVLGAELVRGAATLTVEPSERFVARVMAAIRDQEKSLPAAPDTIWRPLEALASRFAFVAAMVLLALSVYLAGFTPPRSTAVVNSQTEIGAGMPEPPAQPGNADEVLMSLAERADDR